MKKIILVAALMAFATVSFAQLKKPATDTVKKYDRFVKVPVADYNRIIEAAYSYKDGVIYNPNLRPEEKINLQAGLNSYLFQLQKRARIDSALVKTHPIISKTNK